MKKSGGWLINQGRTRSVSRSPWRIDPAKNSECEYDADDCNQRFGMQHPGRAEAIMHPAVGCGHVNNGKIPEGRKRRVFGGSSAAADGEQDDRRKGGVSHSTGQGVGKNANGERVWRARSDSHDNRDQRIRIPIRNMTTSDRRDPQPSRQ